MLIVLLVVIILLMIGFKFKVFFKWFLIVAGVTFFIGSWIVEHPSAPKIVTKANLKHPGWIECDRRGMNIAAVSDDGVLFCIVGDDNE